MARPSISVVAICKNEERDLPHFLANQLAWADQVVVVDDGSTDGTLEIGRAAGERVTFLESPRGIDGGFAGQRNKGIDAATGDWLLHVDVDMRVTPELAKEVRAALAEPGFDAYRWLCLNHFLNRPMRHGTMGADWKPWLVRRGMARWTGVVHEQLGLPDDARIGTLTQPMIHLGDEDFTERLRKNALYSTLEAGRTGRRISLIEGLARSLWVTGRGYLWRKGFLDGRTGLVLAIYQLAGTLNRYLLIWDRQNPIDRDAMEAELGAAMREAGLEP